MWSMCLHIQESGTRCIKHKNLFIFNSSIFFTSKILHWAPTHIGVKFSYVQYKRTSLGVIRIFNNWGPFRASLMKRKCVIETLLGSDSFKYKRFLEIKWKENGQSPFLFSKKIYNLLSCKRRKYQLMNIFFLRFKSNVVSLALL